MDDRNKMLHLILFLASIILTIFSAIKPYHYKYWFSGASPVIIIIVVLLLTYNKFRFTNFTYTLIFISIIFMLFGAHYTYERMPLFTWIKDLFHFGRNHFDRVGHTFLGIAGAIVARELLLRRTPLKKGVWLYFLSVSIVLTLAVANELIEWLSVTYTGDLSYTEIQGDQWDTQWDMFVALIGAVFGLLALSNYHDKQINSITTNKERESDNH